MSISALIQQQDRGTSDLYNAGSQENVETYRTATIYCLVAGDYLQQRRYTLETVILHFALDHTYSLDGHVRNWILLGVVIRIAMRMGLHRDPSHWPNIRPLQAELRRRLWITMYQMDFFTSTQFGLPRIVKDSQCDSRLPAHLFENDLNFEDDELPPERPVDEPTPLLFVTQRHSIVKVAAEIYDITEAGPPSAVTIAVLDAKIQRVIETMPAWLKHRSIESSVAENPTIMLQQIFMDILIHKAVYLLHRRSFVKGSGGEDSAKSNEICIKAALSILEHQRWMTDETQPGGIMFNVRWKVSSSINHEFLQATMMLCFALSKSSDGQIGAAANIDTLQRRDDIIEALRHARSQWETIADQSVDAGRAAKAIAAVLHRDSATVSAGAHVHPSSNGDHNLGFEHQLQTGWGGWTGTSDQVTGTDEPNYFDTLDYGQDVALDALDPSFFMVSQDVVGFESMMENFMTQEGKP